MQTSTVLEKNNFECIFDRFEVHMDTVWSSRIGKTQNTCIFAYGRFFTHFENDTFFERFLKSSESHAKWLNAFYFI